MTIFASLSQEGGCEGVGLGEGSSNGGRAQSSQRTSYSATGGQDDPVQRNAAGERGNTNLTSFNRLFMFEDSPPHEGAFKPFKRQKIPQIYLCFPEYFSLLLLACY